MLHTRQHLHECAFPGPVFADEAMNLTPKKLKIHRFERSDAPEPLANIFK